jgi:hypothetical protein
VTPGGGNQGGNNGGTTTPPAPPPPPTTVPTTPPSTQTPDTIPASGGTDTTTGETVNIPITVNNNTGAVTVQLDETTTNTLLEDALVKAETQGGDAQPTVTLNLSAVENATTAILNVYTAQAFSEAEVAVTVVLPAGEITIAPEALATLAVSHDVGATPITVEASIVPMSDLRGMQAAQVRGFETVISLDVFVGGEKIDVPLTVSLPYTLKPNENPAAVRVWHMDAAGNLTCMNGVFDAATGMITFTISHQSYFVVGYDPVALWINIFNDVSADAWYYEMVAYANFHKLFEGDGQGSFMPNDTMTRAMFVTVLWKLEGQPETDADIAWYAQAVAWAKANNIADFDDIYTPITRQEMAVVLANYADFKNIAIPKNRDMPSFRDVNQIDAWAESAAKALAEAGVMNGADNNFMPQKDATRAEVAGMFRNFLRFVAGQ